jgi:hypothetical protein
MGLTMIEDDDILREAAKPHRVAALEEAINLTTGQRNVDYGDPVENHAHIARIFNAITGKDLSARDIAIVHQATKLARRQNTPAHRDSYVDGAAYTGIEYECALAEREDQLFVAAGAKNPKKALDK